MHIWVSSVQLTVCTMKFKYSEKLNCDVANKYNLIIVSDLMDVPIHIDTIDMGLPIV